MGFGFRSIEILPTIEVGKIVGFIPYDISEWQPALRIAATRQQMVAPTDQRLASLQRDLASPAVLPARPGVQWGHQP
jgi:hypothetical protein